MSGESAASRGSGSNGTAGEEFSDVAFLAANCLILLVTSLVGIGANLFVTWAVYRQKSLQTWTNALLVNLAVIDILRCAVDCPVLVVIVAFAHRRTRVDEAVCTLQLVSFSFSCCIQLLTLACISMERYQAIAHPFKTNKQKKRIALLILLTWTLAILVAGLCATFVKDSPVYVECMGSERASGHTYDTFGLYLLAPLWTACFLVIIGFYSRIFAIVRAHSRKIFDKGVFPVPKEEKADENKKADATDVKPDQAQLEENQTGGQKAAPAEETKQDESDALKITVAVAPRDSRKEPEILVTGPDNKADVHPFMETEGPDSQSPPHEKPVAGNLSREDTAAWRGSLTEPENKARTLNGDSASEAQVQAEPAAAGRRARPSAGQVQPSDVITRTGLKLPGTGDEKPSLESAAQIAEAAEPPGARVSSSERLPGCAEPPSATPLPTGPQREGSAPESEAPPAAKPDKDSVSPQVTNPAPGTAPAANIDGAVCMMPSNRDRSNKNKESKMAKRSAYIIFTFLIFWLPLITTILVNMAVYHNGSPRNRIIQNVEILSVSVACVTSVSDPIIYAAVNPQFRTEYYSIRNKIRSAWKKR